MTKKISYRQPLQNYFRISQNGELFIYAVQWTTGQKAIHVEN